MAAEYNHHHHLILLIAVVLLLVVVSDYTTTPVLGHRVLYNHGSSMKNSTTIQKEKQDYLIFEEKLDRKARRSIALAALLDSDDDPTEFLDLVRQYYENTYMIHPETKVLVRVYNFMNVVNPRMEVLFNRCRRCPPRPAPITEADWKRYEEAAVNVKTPPRRSWITPLDVFKCRLWLEANPPPPPL